MTVTPNMLYESGIGGGGLKAIVITDIFDLTASVAYLGAVPLLTASSV